MQNEVTKIIGRSSEKHLFSTPIDFFFRISDNSFVVAGPMRRALTGSESIKIDGINADKPYLAAILSSGETKYSLMLLRSADGLELEHVKEISFSHPDGVSYWVADKQFSNAREIAAGFIGRFGVYELSKILLLLVKFAGIEKSVLESSDYHDLCNLVRSGLVSAEKSAADFIYLTRNSLFLSAELGEESFEKPTLLVTGRNTFTAAPCEVMKSSYLAVSGVRRNALIAKFKDFPNFDGANLTLIMKDRLIPLSAVREVGHGAPSVINFLDQLNDIPRFNLTGFVNYYLLNQSLSDEQKDISSLIKCLQLSVPVQHTTVYDRNSPFGMNVEAIFPLDDKGIYFSGWLHDPVDQLESLSLVTDLGFSINVPKSSLQRYGRSDVVELYEGSPFANNSEKNGFVCYAEYPAELRRLISAKHPPFSYRVSIVLKGGLRYTISPKNEARDAFIQREKLLNIVPQVKDEEAAFKILRSVLSAIQKICMKKVGAPKVFNYGSPNKANQVSVIIPLYKTYDFIPTQVSAFAGDPYFSNAEIIYVLDLPEHESQISQRLKQLSQIYNLPVTLVVMPHNSGYAAANNAGAKIAKGEYFVLMNSDVVPKSSGWLEKMIHKYQSMDGVGVVAPKLLFEDDSIQHAGMYFEKTGNYEFWENSHYFKGYPGSFAESTVSREVPAVTGACMLTTRKLFEEVGGLSEDYVIGDFEDSDLCLKLHSKGYKSYYLASPELYHFERQSLAKMNEASNARFLVNASIHNDRWSGAIDELMRVYG